MAPIMAMPIILMYSAMKNRANSSGVFHVITGGQFLFGFGMSNGALFQFGQAADQEDQGSRAGWRKMNHVSRCALTMSIMVIDPARMIGPIKVNPNASS